MPVPFRGGKTTFPGQGFQVSANATFEALLGRKTACLAGLIKRPNGYQKLQPGFSQCFLGPRRRRVLSS